MPGGNDKRRRQAILSALRAATGQESLPTKAGLQKLVEGDVPPHIVHQLETQKRRRSSRRLRIKGAVPAGGGDPGGPQDLGSLPMHPGELNVKATGSTFALRVRGDSMVGAQIFDGDLVIVEARSPRPGDIVAALIDGETTLKRLVAEDGRFWLKAENPAYRDLVPVRELVIQGVARAVVRAGDHSRIAL